MTSQPLDDSGPERAHTARITIGVSFGLAAVFLPVFLLAALSVDIGEELGFGPALVGIAATTFFATTALLAVPIGRLTERIGAQNSLRLGAAFSSATCLLTALLAQRFLHMVLALGFVGFAMSLVEAGAAKALADRIRAGRKGLAFGIKQASVPTASLLAGLSLPLIAVAYGWRTAFALGALVGPMTWLILPNIPRRQSVERQRSKEPIKARGPLILLGVGCSLGAAAAVSTATFLVPASIDAGIAPGTAGLLLATGSLVSVSVRLVTGWLADILMRPPAALLAVSTGVGALGAALLALSPGGTWLMVGAVLTLGGGWGWTGLAFLTAVEASPRTPAAAASIVLMGMTSGSAVGPLAFSALVVNTSYTTAWTTAMIAFVLATFATGTAGVLLQRGVRRVDR